MRHDAGAGFEIEQPGPQSPVDPRQQVHGNDRCLADIGFEQILGEKFDAVPDAGVTRVFFAFRGQLFIEVNAEAARAVLFRRGDRDAPIAGAEIDHKVLRADFRHAQHFVHHNLRCRHIGHIVRELRARRNGEGAKRRQRR